ncbi:hypothetical protein TCAL_13577 [Tigriopus californicus]|uniref:Sulfotransferase domain-containing protein n=1 Tax=Tigriopus californicus TaxID=6832 RepID=A0A553NPY2_TIGCA|nr:luciferin sulfotransferase-like [Tigriopus californicus]TRY67470.1 hypothetical protein TCAL_13577 [Tigriopus californicus]
MSCDSKNECIDKCEPGKERSNLPFQWREISEQEQRLRLQSWPEPMSVCRDVIALEPGNVIVPREFLDIAYQIYNFEIRSDDVFVVTFPKSGTTWAQEMIWQITHHCDFEGGKVNLGARSPFLELPMLIPDHKLMPMVPKEKLLQAKRILELARSMPSPRVIKSHLPICFQPPNLLNRCKVVYLARTPKDCCVSYYHHEQLVPIHGYEGDFKSYASWFKRGQLLYGDYWFHLSEAVSRQGHPNLKIIWYEQMKKDLPGVLQETCTWLEQPLSDWSLKELVQHLSFDRFKSNSAVNNAALTNPKTGQCFIRRGKIGDWKNHFDTETSLEWDDWIQEKKREFKINNLF